jgi:hypothetical protein
MIDDQAILDHVGLACDRTLQSDASGLTAISHSSFPHVSF